MFHVTAWKNISANEEGECSDQCFRSEIYLFASIRVSSTHISEFHLVPLLKDCVMYWEAEARVQKVDEVKYYLSFLRW